MHKEHKVILLVEDNPDDVALTMRAFRRSHLANPIMVVHDGVEALDFLFARNAYQDRASQPMPTLVILDLKLPKLDGLGVLKAIRETERMRFLPVVVMTSSKEEQDLVSSYTLGANSYVRKPVDFTEFVEAARVLGIYWMMMNELPPEELSL
jgi:two-component system response regulator